MPSETCNRIRVERYFLEEVGAEEKQATGLHLEACDRCKEQLDSLTRERAGLPGRASLPAFAARHLAKPAPAPSAFGSRPSKWMPVLAGGLACVALAAVLRRPGFLDLQGGSAQPAPGQDGGTGIGWHHLQGRRVAGVPLPPGRPGQAGYPGGGVPRRRRAAIPLCLGQAQPRGPRQRGRGRDGEPLPRGRIRPRQPARKGRQARALPLRRHPGRCRRRRAFRGRVQPGSRRRCRPGGLAGGGLPPIRRRLAALEKTLRPPAAAPSGSVKALLLRKASP